MQALVLALGAEIAASLARYVAYRGPGVEIGVSSFATGAAAGV